MNYDPSASTRGGDNYARSGLGGTGAQSDTRGPRRAPANSSRGRRGRHHASMFHYRGSSSRTINLNYSDGSIAAICEQGLNTITHTTVLKALEQCATRYRVRGRLAEASTRTHNWGLDETGTIDTSGLLQSREEMQQQEEIDIRGVSDEVLQVHIVLPGRKEEGITRLLYENANGIHNRLGGTRN